MENSSDAGTAPAPPTLTVEGELDLATVDDVRERARALTRSGADLVLDMAGVEFCDSTGLRLLVEIHNAVAAAGGTARLRAVPPRLLRTIEVGGLDTVLVLE